MLCEEDKKAIKSRLIMMKMPAIQKKILLKIRKEIRGQCRRRFKNVKDSIMIFTRSERPSIKRWLADFVDDGWVVSEWFDLETVAYSRTLLRGPAWLYMQHQRDIRMCKVLLETLMRELAESEHSYEVANSSHVKDARHFEDGHMYVCQRVMR